MRVASSGRGEVGGVASAPIAMPPLPVPGAEDAVDEEARRCAASLTPVAPTPPLAAVGVVGRRVDEAVALVGVRGPRQP